MNSFQAAEHLGLRVRMVVKEDAEEMEQLAEQNNFNQWWSGDGSRIEIDWGQSHPYWLGAEHEGQLIAVLQVLIGRPIGRMECLLTRNHLRHRVKALAVRLLLLSGLTMLRRNGAQLVAGSVPDELPEYKLVLEHMGGIELCHGSIIAGEVPS